MAELKTMSPKDAAERIAGGAAYLVDIREPDEFARRHVKGALSHPLSRFDPARLPVFPPRDTIFTCKSGMRTAANGERLSSAIPGTAYGLEGGIDSWVAAGLSVEEDRRAPLEIMRQVQIAAGFLVLLGVGMGLLIHPAFFGLAAFVGAGLSFAGLTGFCGMAKLLALMPWNRSRAA